jgi:hypothetical protein
MARISALNLGGLDSGSDMFLNFLAQPVPSVCGVTVNQPVGLVGGKLDLLLSVFGFHTSLLGFKVVGGHVEIVRLSLDFSLQEHHRFFDCSGVRGVLWWNQTAGHNANSLFKTNHPATLLSRLQSILQPTYVDGPIRAPKFRISAERSIGGLFSAHSASCVGCSAVGLAEGSANGVIVIVAPGAINSPSSR